IASPTFFLISGIVLGYLHVTQSKEEFPATRAVLLGRALFLLTVGRILIYLAHVPLAGGWIPAFGRSFITDAIAVSIIIGTLGIRRIRVAYRPWLAFGCYVAAWIMVEVWTPEGLITDFLKKFLAGSPEGYESAIRVDFPLLQWLGVYIMGTVLGERIAGFYARGDERGAARVVLRVSVISFFTSIAVLALQRILPLVIPGAVGTVLYRHIYLSKLPPTIPYFLFYGSIGLAFLFLFLRYSETPIMRGFARHASILGQTSLFAFIFQYFIYFTVFVWMDLPYSPVWPITFLVSAAIVYAASHWWFSRGLNVYLAIPYRRFFVALGIRKGSALSRL
ncbi:MAG: hypothetical protein MUF82_02885, partial [Bacteroidetes bacterium]|nr:hypothetical protein [Bacteroidota bacterium]